MVLCDPWRLYSSFGRRSQCSAEERCDGMTRRVTLIYHTLLLHDFDRRLFVDKMQVYIMHWAGVVVVQQFNNHAFI